MQYKIFGCKVNKYYTDQWLNSGYLKNKSGIFIASCVVTDKAKRKWIKFVKDIAKDIKENEKIFISGCGSFKNGIAQDDFFEIYPDIEYLKGKIEILGEKPEENGPPPNPLLNKEGEQKGVVSEKLKEKIKKLPNLYTKKFLLVQGGCDSFCTFCLTVIKRGRHYFRDKDDIVEEILEYEKSGGKEVVLTGVNLSAWGLKNTNEIGKSRFAELIEYILEKTTIPRLRLSSLGPEFIDKKCLEVFKNTRVYPHFHYSVQSGSTDVLKNMRRHYNGKYIRDLLENTKNIKRDDNVNISIGADIIIGFPGETKKNFEETYNLVKDGLITKVHSFPFSAHTMGESVPAGKFKNQIDEKIKKDRLEKINKISEKVREEFIKSQVGKEFKVLIESVKGKSWKGWSENYIECNEKNFQIKSGNLERNEIIIGNLIN